MKDELVKERLYQKYIEPTKKDREEYIGIEIEMPIVNLEKKAVDFEIVHRITGKFMERFGFQVTGRDDRGNVYSAACQSSGDILSYDCSYNNLELSMGRKKELHTIYRKFRDYYTFLQNAFAKYHYTLTGMGVNPYRIYNHNVPIENGRYRMLFHHLNSYRKYKIPMYFHDYPAYGTFSSASQVQLDVRYEDLLTTLNAFSKLEPIKALLFSNSILIGEHENLLCCRDTFWENSTHGINPHNIGMYECDLDSIDDLQAYIESTSIYCVERGEKYINFAPINIMDYFRQTSVRGEYFEDGVYKEIDVYPQIDDVAYLRTFKFEDLTFRGTIEYRSVCCQPISDCMTVAAFHLGLSERVYRLNEIFEQDHVIYHHGYNAAELRKMLVRDVLPSFINEDDIYELARRVVELAAEGLRERGFGEEIYLNPLYERIEKRTNPAKRMLELKNQGVDMGEIVRIYAKLEDE